MAPMPNDRPLPRPTSGTELYLAAVLDELKLIKAELIQPDPEPEGDEIELKEVGTPIPSDYPGYDALSEAGYYYAETVPNKGDELVAIPGIGKSTANKILTYQKL